MSLFDSGLAHGWELGAARLLKDDNAALTTGKAELKCEASALEAEKTSLEEQRAPPS